MSADHKKFYLTTPIYYVNARPHIGHAYTTIVADVLARRHRLLGDDTFFLTGTDEHGQKIERSAAAAGVPPQQFADEVADAFKKLWERMGLTFDKFIRTTDPEHARGVQRLFNTLYERGFIYLDSYTGSYCVSDEAFVDAPAGTPCPDCGRLLETVTEENFFFKLSAFQDRLIELIEGDTLAITPESRKNEVLSFVRGGLKDLSISRSSFTWGIPVPEPAASVAKQKHVIYVWLDALANYMTAVGYGSDDPKDVAQYERYWPADLHLVGKEIIRFHCVYWPAFLLAADLPLPKAVTAHGWLLFDNAKMSKSKGNIVRTETILEAFGEHVYAKQFPESTKRERDLFASDVLRYFLLREIPFGQDGSFSFDAMVTRYNADLANGYGNLVSRALSMIAKTSPDGAIEDCLEANSMIFYLPELKETHNHPAQKELLSASECQLLGWQLVSFAGKIEQGISDRNFADALSGITTAIASVDQLLTSRKPWAATDTEISQAGRRSTLYSAAEAIRIITALLYPILPFATAKVWSQLGLGDIELAAKNGELNDLQWGELKPGTKLGQLAPIFPRADKGLAQIMIDMEENRNTATANPEPASTTAPDAGPRTSSIAEPGGVLPVAGSSAEKATLPTTPAAHSEAQASGAFASTAAQTPVNARAADASPQINIDDFAKVELRVAQIVVAERIPKADKLLRLEVDLGYERRQILSGIAEWYTPEELIGRRIVVITNLAPRKMRGLESHGMLLAASEGEGGKPVLATFGEEIALGSRLK
jgi:methionyl-tRNA synthetase